MASGQVNRTNRPNTWLHRPSLRREDFSCQPGAVGPERPGCRCPLMGRIVLQNSQNALRLISRKRTKQATIADQCALKRGIEVAREFIASWCGPPHDYLIAALGDAAELLLAAAGVLFRHQPHPGREISSRSENPRIGNAGHQRGCEHRSDAGDLVEPLARLA